MDRNGFEAIFGLRLKGVQAPDEQPAYAFDQPDDMAGRINSAWYSNGTMAYPGLVSANSGKEVAEHRLGTKEQPHITFFANNTGGKSYEEVLYKDGSKDVLTTSSETGRDVTTWTERLVSYDKDGNKTGEMVVMGKQWMDSYGTKHETLEYTTPLVENGKDVGNQTVKVHIENKSNGDKVTTTEVTNNYKDGRPQESAKTEVAQTAPKAKDKDKDKDEEEKGDSGKKYDNPEYIAFNPNWVDWDLVMARVKGGETTLPNPDDPGTGPAPEEPTTPDNPAVILVDPDGVVVISSDDVPNFHCEEGPDYPDPLEWLNNVSGMTGQQALSTCKRLPVGSP